MKKIEKNRFSYKYNDIEIKTSLRNHVYNSLRNAILDGRLKASQRIKQEEVASNMKVSRMPVREAFKMLEQDGLIVIDSKKGSYINPSFMEKIEEIYYIRKMIEPKAIKLVKGKINPQAILDLSYINNDFFSAVVNRDMQKMVDLNKELHLKLYSYCKYPYLNEIINNMWDRFPFYTFSILPGRGVNAFKEHKYILKALFREEYDKAAELLGLHINASQKSYNIKNIHFGEGKFDLSNII